MVDKAGRPMILNNKKARGSGMDNVPDSQIEETVTLSWAAILARKGELKQAEVLLQRLAGRPQASPEMLDLLAKVYAQQRKIEEARGIWLRAIQLDPDNKHFYRALIRCNELLKH